MLRWTTCDLVFFDCDSTLSTIEGVDELARLKGKEGRVGILTQKAMDGELDLGEVYGKRLRAINPTRGQLDEIEKMYWETLVPDAQVVIETLKFLQKHVFIISGGLADAVKGFGKRLGVPTDHIRAVDLEYNELSGQWWRYYDHAEQKTQRYLDYDEGPLTISAGKPDIVRELANGLFGRRLLIGDGASDLATRGNGIDLFVGFGGVVVREKVEKEADVFVYPATLSPVLPLAAGATGLRAVQDTPYETVYRKGLQVCLSSAVKFRDAELAQAFRQEFSDF
jgi:phosphoserine phosphatase